MKTSFWALSMALLLAGCHHADPVTESPAGPAAGLPPSTRRADSAMDATSAPPPDAAATTSAPARARPKPLLETARTLKASFRFRPAPPDPDNPGQARTSVLLLLQGGHPIDIDLGNFAGKPDVVDAAKARAAHFPDGMLMGFCSYSAATGASQDLAVLSVGGSHLRIVQRRVAESAEPGKFETAREIPLPGNTVVVASVPK